MDVKSAPSCRLNTSSRHILPGPRSAQSLAEDTFRRHSSIGMQEAIFGRNVTPGQRPIMSAYLRDQLTATSRSAFWLVDTFSKIQS